jgi:hypothetical protein
MDVRFWGPQFWATLEFLAFNYPQNPSDQDRQNMKTLYSLLPELLPCSSCQTHFAQLLKDYPIQLDSRDTLTRWLVEAHNRVNDRLKKPRVTYDFVADKYQQMRGTCEMGQLKAHSSQKTYKDSGECHDKHMKSIWILVIILVLLMILAFFTYGMCKKSQNAPVTSLPDVGFE